MAALAKGADFARPARERSIGMRAAKGGDTGWVDAASLPPPLQQAAGTLKPGEAGGPLPKGNELLIVALVGRRPPQTKSLTEARPEIERRLLPAKQEEAYKTWLTEQEKKSKIEIFLQPG